MKLTACSQLPLSVCRNFIVQQEDVQSALEDRGAGDAARVIDDLLDGGPAGKDLPMLLGHGPFVEQLDVSCGQIAASLTTPTEGVRVFQDGSVVLGASFVPGGIVAWSRDKLAFINRRKLDMDEDNTLCSRWVIASPRRIIQIGHVREGPVIVYEDGVALVKFVLNNDSPFVKVCLSRPLAACGLSELKTGAARITAAALVGSRWRDAKVFAGLSGCRRPLACIQLRHEGAAAATSIGVETPVGVSMVSVCVSGDFVYGLDSRGHCQSWPVKAFAKDASHAVKNYAEVLINEAFISMCADHEGGVLLGRKDERIDRHAQHFAQIESIQLESGPVSALTLTRKHKWLVVLTATGGVYSTTLASFDRKGEPVVSSIGTVAGGAASLAIWHRGLIVRSNDGSVYENCACGNKRCAHPGLHRMQSLQFTQEAGAEPAFDYDYDLSKCAYLCELGSPDVSALGIVRRLPGEDNSVQITAVRTNGVTLNRSFASGAGDVADEMRMFALSDQRMLAVTGPNAMLLGEPIRFFMDDAAIKFSMDPLFMLGRGFKQAEPVSAELIPLKNGQNVLLIGYSNGIMFTSVFKNGDQNADITPAMFTNDNNAQHVFGMKPITDIVPSSEVPTLCLAGRMGVETLSCNGVRARWQIVVINNRVFLHLLWRREVVPAISKIHTTGRFHRAAQQTVYTAFWENDMFICESLHSAILMRVNIGCEPSCYVMSIASDERSVTAYYINDKRVHRVSGRLRLWAPQQTGVARRRTGVRFAVITDRDSTSSLWLSGGDDGRVVCNLTKSYNKKTEVLGSRQEPANIRGMDYVEGERDKHSFLMTVASNGSICVYVIDPNGYLLDELCRDEVIARVSGVSFAKEWAGAPSKTLLAEPIVAVSCENQTIRVFKIVDQEVDRLHVIKCAFNCEKIQFVSISGRLFIYGGDQKGGVVTWAVPTTSRMPVKPAERYLPSTSALSPTGVASPIRCLSVHVATQPNLVVTLLVGDEQGQVTILRLGSAGSLDDVLTRRRVSFHHAVVTGVLFCPLPSGSARVVSVDESGLIAVHQLVDEHGMQLREPQLLQQARTCVDQPSGMIEWSEQCSEVLVFGEGGVEGVRLCGCTRGEPAPHPDRPCCMLNHDKGEGPPC